PWPNSRRNASTLAAMSASVRKRLPPPSTLSSPIGNKDAIANSSLVDSPVHTTTHSKPRATPPRFGRACSCRAGELLPAGEHGEHVSDLFRFLDGPVVGGLRGAGVAGVVLREQGDL